MRLLNDQFHRFAWAGVFNTLNGYIWILGLQAITNQPLIANVLGYGIAAIIGYITHSRFTFRQRPGWRSAAGYGIVIGSSYLINLMVLTCLLNFLPAMLAQFIAVGSLVVFSYLCQSKFVFLDK